MLKELSFSHVRLFATLWTVACEAPLSMGFPRQEYWSGLPLPSLGSLPDTGIKPPLGLTGLISLQSKGLLKILLLLLQLLSRFSGVQLCVTP